MREATLVLEDGTCYYGHSFGYEKTTDDNIHAENTVAVGEVVFNTAMTGYTESLTDPSYAGQILVMTYPLIGNYGVPESSTTSEKTTGRSDSRKQRSQAERLRERLRVGALAGMGATAGTNGRWPKGKAMGNSNDDETDQTTLPLFMESQHIHVKALVIADYSQEYSHWNAVESLADWLKREKIPAITGIDTRRLTKKIREHGVMTGWILLSEETKTMRQETPKRQNKENTRFGNTYSNEENYADINWVQRVSCKKVTLYQPTKNHTLSLNKHCPTVVLVDCGVKANIIRCLLRRGVQVIRVPWDYDFNQLNFDALFLSNGPGNPELCEKTVQHIRTFLENKHVRPCMGICLGNQLLARAAGAHTYKLKYGHRSHNQPVRRIGTTQCFITSQNHGYAVDVTTLPDDWEPMFVNMNDNSNEGIRHKTKPWMSAQFHPEASGGPTDTVALFDEFVNSIIPTPQTKNTCRSTADNPDDERDKFIPSQGKTKPQKVLMLGSGALKIGQAGEFDYSGAQALKALKEEGILSVLINPNIATVQTSKDTADTVYFQPLTPELVERVIEKEKPDGILLAFGGQTALNCGVELYKKGVLKKYGVNVIGTPIQAIIDTEDRELFVKRLDEIGVKTNRSIACSTVEQVHQAALKLGLPVIIRAAYALGGLGSGFCNNENELKRQAEEAFSFSTQVLVEKALRGWKEIEYEVVRDRYDNCITVCNMENFDPLGIHTGESIVVAPSQTLTDSEYHKLRALAIKIVRHIGIVGECNVQYALDPTSDDYRVIEVNARLSRSSALASKATGYPLAFVAAKLGLGYGLFELKNSVTKSTTAFFEPALDYVVVKIPRWDLSKFQGVSHLLGSSMKSVGEVMAIGRTFEEAIQKGLRMVGQGMHGFVGNKELRFNDICHSMQHPTDSRMFVLSKALRMGYNVGQIHNMTKIDQWFLMKLKHIVNIEQQLREYRYLSEIITFMDKYEFLEYIEAPDFANLLRMAKVYGFSDFQIARAIGLEDTMTMEQAGLNVRQWRKELGIVPVVNQIDTLAAEYPAKTNYIYMSYL